ncbi:MAG: DNA-directed RNA polymerase, partial [Methanobacteriota archaeon]
YHKTEFSALVYLPVVGELVEAEVVEIVDFGAFVRLGPMDGLVHISQVTDDYIVRDRKQGILVGKETKRILREGDKVRARVVTVSMKGSGTSKIGLSMRQPGLGKFEWIEEEKKGEEGSKG